MWADWPLPSGAVSMTSGEAQARQDAVRARREHLIWFTGPAGGGAIMARARTADFRSGVLLPEALTAPTLAELRQMMPAELTTANRQADDPSEIIRIWWDLHPGTKHTCLQCAINALLSPEKSSRCPRRTD